VRQERTSRYPRHGGDLAQECEGRGGARGERKRRGGEEARDLRGKPLKEGSKGKQRRGGGVMVRVERGASEKGWVTRWGGSFRG